MGIVQNILNSFRCCHFAEDNENYANANNGQIQAQSTAQYRDVIENTKNLQKPTLGLQYFLENSVSTIPESAIAIDLGSGGGRNTRVLANCGWSVIAIDTAQEAGEVLNLSDPGKVKFVHGSLFDAVIAPASIHLINAQNILSLLSPEELHETLCRSQELLAPNGMLAASFCGISHSWNGVHENKHFYREADIERILDRAGFSLSMPLRSNQATRVGGNGEQIKNSHWILVVAKKKATSANERKGLAETTLRSELSQRQTEIAESSSPQSAI